MSIILTCFQVFKFGGLLDPLWKNLRVHCKVLGVKLIYSPQEIFDAIMHGALTLTQVEKHANYLLTKDSF